VSRGKIRVSRVEARYHFQRTVFHSSLDARHSSLFPHRFNGTRKNSDDFVEQLDPSFDLILSQPVFHPFVAPTRLTSRASRNVEEPNVLNSPQSTITLFDVCADRICAASRRQTCLSERAPLLYIQVVTPCGSPLPMTNEQEKRTTRCDMGISKKVNLRRSFQGQWLSSANDGGY
jgi:hypothetical protein